MRSGPCRSRVDRKCLPFRRSAAVAAGSSPKQQSEQFKIVACWPFLVVDLIIARNENFKIHDLSFKLLTNFTRKLVQDCHKP